MTLRRRIPNIFFKTAAALFCLASTAHSADSVILLLRNGDRLTGTIVSQDTNRIVLSTPWIKELIVPLSQISKREPVPPAQKPANPAVIIYLTKGTQAGMIGLGRQGGSDGQLSNGLTGAIRG